MDTREAFQLIVENESLIVSQIRKGALGATKEEIEDVHSILKIELAERLTRDFDPSRGVKATTYMGMVARSRALDLVRNKHRFHAAFDCGEDDSEESYGYSAELAATDTGVASFEAREEIRLALSELDSKLGGAEFALDCFSGELDTSELMEKYNLPEGTVYSRRSKIREFLKSRLSR